jgi:peptidoglycan/LPS O-acetylase OafA/YrhL
VGAIEVLVSLYATVLPFAVVGGLMAVALWDLARREALTRAAAVGATVAVVVLPVVGAAVVLLRSPTFPRERAIAIVGGSVLAVLLVLVLAVVVGATA